MVAVHLRPLIYDELMQGCQECLRVTEGEPQVSSTAIMMLLRRTSSRRGAVRDCFARHRGQASSHGWYSVKRSCESLPVAIVPACSGSGTQQAHASAANSRCYRLLAHHKHAHLDMLSTRGPSDTLAVAPACSQKIADVRAQHRRHFAAPPVPTQLHAVLYFRSVAVAMRSWPSALRLNGYLTLRASLRHCTIDVVFRNIEHRNLCTAALRPSASCFSQVAVHSSSENERMHAQFACCDSGSASVQFQVLARCHDPCCDRVLPSSRAGEQ